MSVGGATWDDAGTLTFGDNTFDLADVTETGSFLRYMHAWWTFTPATDQAIHLSTVGTTTSTPPPDTVLYVYTGATEAEQVLAAVNDDTGTSVTAEVSLVVLAGVTYHVLVAASAPGGVGLETYHLGLSAVGLGSTPLLDTFRERDDNQIIVGTDALRAANTWFEWVSTKPWYSPMMYGDDPAPGRTSHYHIQSVEDGADLLEGADECAWPHAVNGDQSGPVTLWNTTTDEAEDNGPPTCRPIGEGVVVQVDGLAQMRLKVDFNAPDTSPFVAGGMTAEVDLTAFGPSFRYARDNLDERGALPLVLADPIDDDVPADKADEAVLVWDGILELLSIEATGDSGGADVDPLDAATFAVNDAIGPPYSGSWGTWLKGVLGVADFTFTYEDTTAWHTLPFDDFADLAESGPDTTITAAITAALSSTLPSTWNDDFTERTNGSQVGYRLTFRSPQYRWVWVDDSAPSSGSIPPRRIFQRSDAMTHGARRVIGGGNTRQHGTRVFGHIL